MDAQIKPYKEGTYTVDFCGPGDPHCLDAAAASTATKIEGDAGYEVLAPDRIRIVHGDAYKPLYLKCTADPHPLLEYSAADQAEGMRGLAFVIVVHLVNLALAVTCYRWLSRRLQLLPAARRRTYRTLSAALLFAPGMVFSWPFASPTFALPALVLNVIAAPFTGIAMLPVQLLYSLGPIAVAWALLFVVARQRATSQGTPGAPAVGALHSAYGIPDIRTDRVPVRTAGAGHAKARPGNLAVPPSSNASAL